MSEKKLEYETSVIVLKKQAKEEGNERKMWRRNREIICRSAADAEQKGSVLRQKIRQPNCFFSVLMSLLNKRVKSFLSPSLTIYNSAAVFVAWKKYDVETKKIDGFVDFRKYYLLYNMIMNRTNSWHCICLLIWNEQ